MSERADYFDVQHPFLLGALDRFAQFFLCPLFSESATEREMKAGKSADAAAAEYAIPAAYKGYTPNADQIKQNVGVVYNELRK